MSGIEEELFIIRCLGFNPSAFSYQLQSLVVEAWGEALQRTVMPVVKDMTGDRDLQSTKLADFECWANGAIFNNGKLIYCCDKVKAALIRKLRLPDSVTAPMDKNKETVHKDISVIEKEVEELESEIVDLRAKITLAQAEITDYKNVLTALDELR